MVAAVGVEHWEIVDGVDFQRTAGFAQLLYGNLDIGAVFQRIGNQPVQYRIVKIFVPVFGNKTAGNFLQAQTLLNGGILIQCRAAVIGAD